MTKAIRPCTLPKGWKGNGLIDSNNGYTLQIRLIDPDDAQALFISHLALLSKVEIKLDMKTGEYTANILNFEEKRIDLVKSAIKALQIMEQQLLEIGELPTNDQSN